MHISNRRSSSGQTGILYRIIALLTVVILIMTPMSYLTGCAFPWSAEKEADDDDDIDNDNEDDDDDEDDEESTEESSEDESEEEPEELTIPDMAVSSNVWTVGDRIIVFASDRIISYDRNSGKSQLLWKDMKKADEYDDSEMAIFSSGTGLVLGDRIYFTRSEYYSDEEGNWLNKVHVYKMGIDGKGQKSIFELKGVNSYDQDLAYKDGILYLAYSNAEYPECLKLDETGDLVETVEASTLNGFDYDPAQYMIPNIEHNGHKFIFPGITAAESGKDIFNKDYNTLTVKDTATGESTYYKDQYAVSMHGDKLLMYHYNSSSVDTGYEYGVLDLGTEKYKKLIYTTNSLRVFSMDDEYIYYCDPEGFKPCRDYSYLKCDIATGETTPLYTFRSDRSELPNVSEWSYVSSYSDGTLYTVLNKDYKLSFVGVDAESGDTDVILKEFYDPGIADVGTLEYMDDVKEYDGKKLSSARVSVLQLSDKYPGAAKINKTLMDQGEGVIGQMDDSYEECVQWYEESGGEYFIPYEFTSDFSYISYNDGKIINIVQEGYDYYGGAHGMPYRISYVFDLNTGERLELKDLITISEEELDELLVEYATKHMNEIGESYWDDYEESVKMSGGYDCLDFIIEDDGIDFFYPPYLLTSFAGGFQDIVVPYEHLGATFR